MEDIDKPTQKKYNKRAYTNEFETNAMIWAHSDKTYIGEQKLFYRKGKWVLLEKSDDGYNQKRYLGNAHVVRQDALSYLF